MNAIQGNRKIIKQKTVCNREDKKKNTKKIEKKKKRRRDKQAKKNNLQKNKSACLKHFFLCPFLLFTPLT